MKQLIPYYKKSDSDLLARLDELMEYIVTDIQRRMVNTPTNEKTIQDTILEDPLFGSIVREKSRLLSIMMPIGYTIED